MIQQETIRQVIETQKGKLQANSSSLERELLPALPNLNSHALIISGIRRCGKSTLLLQMLKQKHKNSLYLNFEDPRLFGFQCWKFGFSEKIIAAVGDS